MEIKTSIKLFLIPTVLFAVFFAFGNEARAATTYYVSPSGNDNNSGSSSAPFKTIQHAADVVNAGDMVIVKDGTYTDTDGDGEIFRVKRRGTANNWITFKAENKWGAVLSGGTLGAPNATSLGIVAIEASYIRFEDFEVKNNSMVGASIYVSDHIYFYRLKIHDVGRYQLFCPGYPPYIDPNNMSVWYGKGGYYTAVDADSVTVDSCVTYNIGRLSGGCLYADYNHDHGIYAKGSNLTVINSIFYNTTTGWSGWSIALDDGSTGHKIINNTFYGQNGNGFVHPGQIILLPNLSNVTIENNIFHTPSYYGIRDYGGERGNYASNVTVKNNLAYNASGTLYDGVINYNGGGGTYTISDNIGGQDPKFVDLANRDFHLQAGSPAIDAGLNASAYTTKDFDFDNILQNINRPQGAAYDIGAYEYVGTKVADTTPPASPNGLSVH